MLRLPNFTKEFVIEIDASKISIGGVLMQEVHPRAYFRKKLGPKMQLASTYVRELFALTEAMAKWQHYLLGQHFIIRNNHKSLKEFLTQVIQTPKQ